MNRTKTFETIVNIIADVMGMDDDEKESIISDEYLVDFHSIDLFDIDDILIFIEEEFDVELDIYDDQYGTLTIDDIINAIEEALASA